MSLTAEDTLRLNVLMATHVDAIRIDENRLVVHGLKGESEVKVPLHPDGRADQYLKRVREFLSGHVLGSPGGYPVYLKRWTRMGQARDESLADLLMLGEPEAVVAVACAAGLTDELARRVWWIAQDPENARRMLERPAVVQGRMGKVLADFLVEFLPFEAEPTTIMRSVELVLQPGLIDEGTRQKIWDRGRAKNVYRIGFLTITPDALPERQAARADYGPYHTRLAALVARGNPVAELLDRVLSGPGQTFVQAARDILKKPANQEAVIALLHAVAVYFAAAAPPGHEVSRDVDVLLQRAAAALDDPSPVVQDVLEAVPELRPEVEAMVVLGQAGEPIVLPIFATSTAIGSLMRRQLEPVTVPLFRQFGTLLGAGAR